MTSDQPDYWPGDYRPAQAPGLGADVQDANPYHNDKLAKRLARFIDARWPAAHCRRCSSRAWWCEDPPHRSINVAPEDYRLICRQCGNVEIVGRETLHRFGGRSA